jgi:hypothetical protein
MIRAAERMFPADQGEVRPTPTAGESSAGTVKALPWSDVVALVYELLDVHEDPAILADDLAHHLDTRWQIHLAYLQSLQRSSRAAVARGSLEIL